jgi:hypothetical protein
MERSLGQSVELIVSKDDDDDGGSIKSAKRLRDIATGNETNPPAWIVSVGMVSEGVDIPAIKVIAFLNQITTLLFLIQLIGRALRRIAIRVEKTPEGEDKTIYADPLLTATEAFVFAPAHPVIVKTGLELEQISNQAIAERMPKATPSKPGPDEPSTANVWNVVGGDSTEFYRGHYIKPEWQRSLLALENDQVAVGQLGQFWFGMILDWITRELTDEVDTEIEKRLAEFDIVVEKSKTKTKNYDEDTATLKTRAQALTQLLRFAHPSFRPMPDETAFNSVRRYVTSRSRGSWKEFKKLGIEEKNTWIKTAERILAEECHG